MLKILIADDSDSVVFFVKQQLDLHLNSPFIAYEAQDGQAALAIFEQQNIDIVITDICMPNMDGYELISTIRSFSNVPIIAMSSGQFANQDSHDVFTFAEGLGADFTLDKSEGFKHLGQIVDVVMYMNLKVNHNQSLMNKQRKFIR